MNNEVKFLIKYEGGDAEENKLDLYDASQSLHGLARSIAVSMHAFLNDGQIRYRVKKITGAKIFVEPSKRGSFQELITIVVDSGLVEDIGPTVMAGAAWEFLKWSWAKAVGKTVATPKSRHAQKILKKNEDLEDDISVALEAPIVDLHSPIEQDKSVTITISKHLTKDAIVFDKDTLSYVSVEEKGSIEKEILGNVTRYNILSGNGRFFCDELQRTVSFGLDSDVSPHEKQMLTWSMDQCNNGKGGKILIDANRIINKRGETKRFVIVGVRVEETE